METDPSTGIIRPLADGADRTKPRAPVLGPRPSGKRLCDIGYAAAGIALFTPVLAGAALAILYDDGGPVTFRQTRLGQKRRRFDLLKLRTMRDGEVTRVGRWLRATGLDEAAQFVNVLRGEMSMVGPRPLTEADVERLGWTGPEHDARFEAKPGITGLAQLWGGRSARHSLRLDRLYLAQGSPALDLELIGLSFAANILGKAEIRRLMRRRTTAAALRRWTRAIRRA